MTHPRNLAPAPDRNAVLTKALLRAAERLGLSGRQLSGIVGISEATVSRLKRGEALRAGERCDLALHARDHVVQFVVGQGAAGGAGDPAQAVLKRH